MSYFVKLHYIIIAYVQNTECHWKLMFTLDATLGQILLIIWNEIMWSCGWELVNISHIHTVQLNINFAFVSWLLEKIYKFLAFIKEITHMSHWVMDTSARLIIQVKQFVMYCTHSPGFFSQTSPQFCYGTTTQQRETEGWLQQGQHVATTQIKKWHKNSCLIIACMST